MQDLTIAIIQTNQFWEDKEKNFNHFEKHLAKIEKGSVDLVLFPEMFNTSFTMNVENLAETISGKSIKWLKNNAKELDTQIGATLIIEENGKYYNRFVIVSKNGVEVQYNKRHLFSMAKEDEHFTKGESREIYQLKGWNILLQICYDLRFPVFSRNKIVAGKKEYDLLVYLANWPERRAYVWRNLLQARAIENQVYCIGVNRVGQDGNGIVYQGDSMIVNPWGKIDLHIAKNKELVKNLTLKKQVLNEVEIGFSTFKDAD